MPSCADYRDYQYLWSEETQKPNAVIKLDKELVENEDGQTVVRSAVFSLCPMGRFHLPCEPLVDVNANHAGDFVFGWLVSSRREMLLWGVQESHTAEPPLAIFGILPDERADTVLYVTNVHTGETRELFRLSELGVPGVYADDFDWSPDGKTVMLSLWRSTGVYQRKSFALVLTLDWGD